MKIDKVEQIFEEFKNVEITPIPHFLTELLELPKEQMDFVRKIADEHTCTTSYVIAHLLGDLVTETKDISELTEDAMIKASKDKLIGLHNAFATNYFSKLLNQYNGQQLPSTTIEYLLKLAKTNNVINDSDITKIKKYFGI